MNPNDINNLLENKQVNPEDFNYYDLNDSFLDDGDVVSDNSENEFFKLTLQGGNYTEEEIINNLEKGSKEKSKKKKKAKKVDNNNKENKENVQTTNNLVSEGPNILNEINNLNEEAPKKSKPKVKKLKKNSDSTAINTVSNNLNNINSPEILLQPEKEKEKSQNEETIILNNLLKISTNSPSNDETLTLAIKEFLNVENFPTETKEKLSIIKKFSTIFKKVREDETRLGNFLFKLGDCIKESIDDLKIIFEFEFLKTKREGMYSNLSKILKSFSTLLIKSNMTNITNTNLITNNKELSDSINNIMNKTTAYFLSTNDVW